MGLWISVSVTIMVRIKMVGYSEGIPYFLKLIMNDKVLGFVSNITLLTACHSGFVMYFSCGATELPVVKGRCCDTSHFEGML